MRSLIHWEEGDLSDLNIAELPSLLQWSQGLTELNLESNQIADVSRLTLPEGLTRLKGLRRFPTY